MLQKFTLVLLAIALTGFSQKVAGQQSASVEGKVLDSSSVPLQSATVVLYGLPDSSIVEGTISDIDGRFTFNRVSPNNYFVQVSFVGFRNRGFRGVSTQFWSKICCGRNRSGR